MDITQYLKRINFFGTLTPDLNTLTQLQHHHLFTVPFEDLDIYYGIPFALDKEAFFQKVVVNNRGGYCYELNSLFYELLTAIGFNVTYLSGRVGNGRQYGPEFDHMALMVTIDQVRWLVDVGFGDFALKPLAIIPGMVQNDGRCNYRITDGVLLDGIQYMNVEKWNGSKGIYVSEYLFTLTPRKFEDFEAMNQQQQISADSHFVKNLMCSLPLEDGRISIVNSRIIKTVNGSKRMKSIQDGSFQQYLLEKYFNIQFIVPAFAHQHS